MAASGDASRSSTSGSASMQTALASSSVTRSRCRRFTSGRMAAAWRFSVGVPLLSSTVSAVTSSATRPMVRPDMMPATSTSRTLRIT